MNLHGVSPTAPSTLRVYRFRHSRPLERPLELSLELCRVLWHGAGFIAPARQRAIEFCRFRKRIRGLARLSGQNSVIIPLILRDDTAMSDNSNIDPEAVRAALIAQR